MSEELSDTQNLSREHALEHYTAMRENRSAWLRSYAVTYGVLCLVSVLIVILALVGMYLTHISLSLTVQDDSLSEALETTEKQAIDVDPFYMLLLGVDKGEERYDTEGEDPSNYRTDTIILCRVDPTDVKATLVSIHRDILTDLPDGSQGKINSTYQMGGPAAIVSKISDLAGVPIHHYMEIDFDSFMSTVDALGGVEVTLPVDVRDPEYTGIDLAAGTHVLNGHDALMLSRARHAYDEYGDGDLFRAANQRAVISSILRKVLSSDPATMLSTVSAMAQGVSTDLSLDEILALAVAMRSFDPQTDMYGAMTPTAPEVIDGIYFEILDEAQWQAMMERVKQGLPPYDSADEDRTVGIAGTMSDTMDSLPKDEAASDAQDTPAAAEEQEQDQAPEEQDDTEADTSTPSTLDNADKTGSVMFVGINNGMAFTYASELAAQGFVAEAAEDPNFGWTSNVVVYADPAFASEAEAIAAYLGGDFVAMPNDGSYTMFRDIVVRMRP